MTTVCFYNVKHTAICKVYRLLLKFAACFAKRFSVCGAAAECQAAQHGKNDKWANHGFQTNYHKVTIIA